MHPDVKKLLEVQKIDQAIARVRRDLEALPRETALREKQLGERRRKAEERKAALTEAELASRRIEKAIQQADEEIKKLEGRLNTVKNNAEYQATLFQIESVRRERGKSEEEGLGVLDQMEGLKAAHQEAARELAEEEQVFGTFQQEALSLRGERETEMQRVSAGRSDRAKTVPPDLLDRYERLFSVRDGLAVCAVENQVCQGCYTNVTVNDLARLMGRSSIVQCNSCQRILYLPE